MSDYIDAMVQDLTTPTPTRGRISAEEVERFNEEGWLKFDEPVFSQEKFEALKDHFEAKLAQWPEDERPEAMDTPHLIDPKLFEWALADEVVDIVEPILGPDIVLFSTHFICKPKGDGRRVPWHEDSAYWKTAIFPPEVVTVWLAIDPSTVENGCMHVIPRTHNTGRKGFSDYEPVDTSTNVFDKEILPRQRRDELAIPIELEPNHASLHDSRLMHGSPANHSEKRRCGWTLRFMKASSRLNPERHDTMKVYLARGRNLCDQPLGDPTRSYEDVMRRRLERKIKSH